MKLSFLHSSNAACIVAILVAFFVADTVHATNCNTGNQNVCNGRDGCQWTPGVGCGHTPEPTPAPQQPNPTPAPQTSPTLAPQPGPTPAPVPLPACSTYQGGGSCPDDRCVWSSGDCLEPEDAPCEGRNGGNCEIGDGRCLKIRGHCVEVHGSGGENAPCVATLTEKDNGNPQDEELIYAAIEGHGCAAGYVCNVFNASNADETDVEISGFCEQEECAGKKVPGNCNGNNPNDPDCVSATERVTICHRTCSATNPWVRITIDEDAWDGEGCGHKLQHDIRDECKNKAPWTEWGVNRKDYLIKRHGTRAQVAANRTTAEVKAYWRKWEHACPYVRNGACCDWHDPENPCCGEENPTALSPEIKIIKYAGPPGYCEEGGMAMMEDVLYTVPDSTASWTYCYEISIPDTSDECLIDMEMNDPAPVGGTGGSLPVYNSTGGTLFCPGHKVYVEGSSIHPGSSAPEGPYDATVVGTGELTLQEVTDSDPAGVTIPFNPSVKIKKYAGPPGSCPVDMDTGDFDLLEDATYNATELVFEFCYIITNDGDECLLNAQMTDAAPNGITTPLDLGGDDGKFCPGDTVTVAGPSPTPTDGEPNDDATVTGTGEHSDENVSDTDPAEVVVPNYVPQVEIRKTAGRPGSCPMDMTDLEAVEAALDADMEEDIYTTLNGEYIYCYLVKNTGNECLLDAVMTDAAQGGIGTYDLPEEFCPGDFKVVSGPMSHTEVDLSPEDAEATGTGEYSKTPVSDQDPGGIEVPQSCPFDMPNPGSGFCPHGPGLLPVEVIGAEESPNDYDMFYDITPNFSSVTFTVNNPYYANLKMYVQYHAPTETVRGGWREACDDQNVGVCGDMSPITADCLYADGNPYTLIQVFFWDETGSTHMFGGAEVEECCENKPPANYEGAVAQYSFLLRCACPPMDERKLSEGHKEVDVDKIVAMFKERRH